MEFSTPSTVCRWHQAEFFDRLRGKARLSDLSCLKVEPHEPKGVQQGHMQGLAPGSGQSPVPVQTGKWMDWGQPHNGALGEKTLTWAGHVCLHMIAKDLIAKSVISWASQKEVWPTDRERWFSLYTPFSWDLTRIRRYGLRVPEDSQEKDQRTGTPLLWRKAESVEVV